MYDNINMQDYHTATMKNIDNLLSLETYLYNNINKLSRGGGANDAAVRETTERIKERKIDKNYYRPTEVDLLIGDSSKARKELKWKPKYNLDSLIDDMINTELEELNNNE